MAMLGLFSALLGQGLSGVSPEGKNIPRIRSFGGGGRGHKRRVPLSAEAVRKRKAKRRMVKKSRAINAATARKSRFSR